MSDLTEKSVTDLGGSSSELEMVTFEVASGSIKMTYRDDSYDVADKIFF
jgi:hypothetical protein